MYRILSVDGAEAAEQLLNEILDQTTELVSSHVVTVGRESATETQENAMLQVPVTRFTFIVRTP